MVIFSLAISPQSSFSAKALAKTEDLPAAGVTSTLPSPSGSTGVLEVVSQAVSMETAITPASIREAIFLSFIVNFSSLWCIKDRDPKQAERKVLSFQRHYSIPPPVSRPDLLFFRFCFLFFTPRRRRESIFFIFMRHFVYVYALPSPLRRFAPAPPRGEPSHHRQQRQSWRSGKGSGKFASPQGFPLSTGVSWLPPHGGAVTGCASAL